MADNILFSRIAAELDKNQLKVVKTNLFARIRRLTGRRILNHQFTHAQNCSNAREILIQCLNFERKKSVGRYYSYDVSRHIALLESLLWVKILEHADPQNGMS